ncbi:nuclear pore complex protein NUP98A-like [Syzygium oleosum]|uniref:nuclear pore complex protein NUP98A-like n=1 Tax=Syzygium oleosum TaxID=219896 RepID=UPI0024BB8902|nr:nuclear pore complex protein NUP98A-like [Syzygium oleosum]
MSVPTSSSGEPTSSTFGPQSTFGQANNANINPFVGGRTHFVSPTGGSVFGGTSTGVFGGGFTQTPSLLSSGAAFGDSSSPAIGGSSPLGQNPAFELFGFTPAQTSTSDTTGHPSQPAFGSSNFGSSTPFGAQSQSEFSASSTPGFGSSAPGFGTTSTPIFVTDSAPSFRATSTPAIGSTVNAAFGATSAPIFGSGGAVGASSNPASTSTPAFVTDSAPLFGATSTPAFGSTVNAAFGTRGIAFGATSAPIFGSGGAFGASSNPASTSTRAFVTDSAPSFGATSTPAFGSTVNSAFGTRGIAFGATNAPVFGSGGAFGASSNPASTSTRAFVTDSAPSFGATSTPAIGSTVNSAFGTRGIAFGATNAPIFGSGGAFGASSNPASTSTPAFFTDSAPSFGATSTPASGSTVNAAFGTRGIAFGATSSPASSSTVNAAFGSRGIAFGATSAPIFGSGGAFGASSNPASTSTRAFVTDSAPSFGATSSPASSSTGNAAFGSRGIAFGATNAPIFGSGGAFGASSNPASTSTRAFVTDSAPSFGATSTPAFGSTVNSAFGTRGIASGATNAPVFGSGGAFGASSNPASTSTRAFVTDSAPSFGATSTPAFGSTVNATFGTRGIAFGATNGPIFGSGGAFGASSNPASTSTRAFVTDSAPSFGATSTPASGSAMNAVFGATNAPVFGRGGAFGASSNPAFGPSNAHGAHIGSQVATPTFGNTEFGKSPFEGQLRGSCVAPFTLTTEADTGVMLPAKLQSICGGPNHAGQSGVGVGPGTYPVIPWPTFSQPSPFSSTTASDAISSAPASTTTPNPFSFTTSSNELSMTAPDPFVPNPSSNAGFWPSPNTSPFGSSSLTSAVRLLTSAFEDSAPPSIFSSSVSATLGSSPLVIGAPTTQSSPLSSSTTPLIAETASAFRQTPASFSQTTAPLGQTTKPTFGQIHTFSTVSSGSGGSLLPSSPSRVLSTNAAAITQTNDRHEQVTSKPLLHLLPCIFSMVLILYQICLVAGTGGFGSQNAFGQSHCGQSSINGSSSVVQPALITNPFGILPAVQQLSIGCTETGSPVQHGISSVPVRLPVQSFRKSRLLSARHLSLRQTRLPVRKYHPDRGVQRVPFFYDGDNTPSKPEADALFIPRENPRSLVIGPEYWPAKEQKPSPLKKTSPYANDGVPKDGPLGGQTDFVKASQKLKGVLGDSSLQNDEEYVIIKGAGESAIGYDCGAGIEALMPKLCQPDYYTEPHITELAAKESAEPGFCCRVKDFVVGRLGYGHIKFVGETDVRRLDLESLIRFNNREVIVYADESKKPPIGQGLNKPAEVTLLNIKCIDKKTGKQYIEGPKVEKYKEMLKKAAEKQGAEFVYYDPFKGEWKFKVRHFS